MFRHSLKPKNLLKLSLAALLSISLSGVYYLVCCQEIYAAGATAQHAADQTAGSGHCDFFKKKVSETSTGAARLNALESCALKFNFYVAKLEKKEFSRQSPVLATNFFNFLESVKPVPKAGFTVFAYRAPALEKGDLQIKNCVFRI